MSEASGSVVSPTSRAKGFGDLDKESSTGISIVETHVEGEAYDVVIGGFEKVPGGSVYEKQLNFRNKYDRVVELLINEPRSWSGKNAVFLLDPIDRKAGHCLIFARNDEYIPFSVSGIIAAVKVLSDGSYSGDQRSHSRSRDIYVFETIAGRVMAKPDYEVVDSKRVCKGVTVYGVPSFVFEQDYEVEVAHIGTVSVDIAYGGVFCAFVDVGDIELKNNQEHAKLLVESGQLIHQAIQQARSDIIHPKNNSIRGITNVVFVESVEPDGEERLTTSTTVVMPGRINRNPSGTSLSAWLAVLYNRGQINNEPLRSYTFDNSELTGNVHCECEVGGYTGINPYIGGKAWVTAVKQVVMDPKDLLTKRLPKKEDKSANIGLGINMDG
ncbi:Proline racemase [Penicillium malachiteum]|uniref:Proline racemase n=1 Tax=Penicillium malachiteum TaxID=1324776 RepID=A0AAD6MUM0_9EURO|nr:Proline racemase [Penicillium malachiteum]